MVLPRMGKCLTHQEVKGDPLSHLLLPPNAYSRGRAQCWRRKADVTEDPTSRASGPLCEGRVLLWCWGSWRPSPEPQHMGYLLGPRNFPHLIYPNPNHSLVLTPSPLHQDMIQILTQTPPDQVMESKCWGLVYYTTYWDDVLDSLRFQQLGPLERSSKTLHRFLLRLKCIKTSITSRELFLFLNILRTKGFSIHKPVLPHAPPPGDRGINTTTKYSLEKCKILMKWTSPHQTSY